MLRVNKLPEILRGVLQDGAEGCVLMTSEGSTLASEFISSDISETVLSAICSSMWSNYSRVTSGEILQLQIIKFEHGILGISRAGEKYIIGIYGKDIKIGMLRVKLEALNSYFSRVFDQLK